MQAPYSCEGTFDGLKVHVRRVRTLPGGDLQNVKEVRIGHYISYPRKLTDGVNFHELVAKSKRLVHPSIVPYNFWTCWK